VSRVKKLRLGAALIGVTATALLAAAVPASADAATGTLPSTDGENGYKVHLENQDKNEDFDTKLFSLKVGDKTLKTYCVDIHTKIKAGSEYVEVPWDKHPRAGSSFNKNGGKILWILQNSYPQVTDLNALATKVGEELDNGLSKKEAITATQVAIWHFSDDMKLKKDNPVDGALTDGDSAKDIVKLYDYLVGAKNVGIKEQPKPELNLEPNKLTGKPGTTIGPFVVTTTAQNVKVEAVLPAGVTLTDKDGKSLDQAAVASKIQSLDKYEFFVKVPADAKADKVDFTVSGTTNLTLGRLFISSDTKNKPSQSLILAKTESVPLSTKGTADWTVEAAPDTTPQAKNDDDALAKTGASIMVPAIIGVVLVGAGVGALLFVRRRRNV
jgi:TQXA domain-containing protein/LPXTG-motif cell wall-anchored protein